MRRMSLSLFLLLAWCGVANAASSFSGLPAATQPVGSIPDAIPLDQGTGCPTNVSPCVTKQTPSTRLGQPVQTTCSSVSAPFTYQTCIDTSVSPVVLKEYIGGWVPLYSLNSSGIGAIYDNGTAPNGIAGTGYVRAVLGTAINSVSPLINFDSSGLPGISYSNGFRARRTTTGALDALDYGVFRYANYVGGTNGFVNAAFKAETQVQPGTLSFEWTGLFLMNNYGTIGDAGESVAVYGSAVKFSTGGTWGGVFDAADYNTTDPLSGAPIGAEISVGANGADVAGNRTVLQVTARKRIAGANAVIQRAILFNSGPNVTFTSGLEFNGAGPTTYTSIISATGAPTTTNGIDISGFTCSVTCFKSPGFSINGSGTATMFGAVIGAPTGGDKGANTMNIAGAIWDNGTAPTGTLASGYVRATSPTLVTPALGTPSAVVLTNATGLPVGSGISGLGAGIATWLATPSSANLATAVTDETGSGALVFGTSPTIASPTLTSAIVGAPTGGNKGAGTINIQGTIWTNGTQGIASQTCTVNQALTLVFTNGLLTGGSCNS